MTLRVRTKGDTATLTLKVKDQKWETGASSREFDFPITDAPQTLCLADYPALTEELHTRVQDLPDTLSCLGSLTTARTCFPLGVGNLTAELDESRYFDCIDYELECELPSKDEEPAVLNFLKNTFSLTPTQGVCGKYHRFLNRWKKQGK